MKAVKKIPVITLLVFTSICALAQASHTPELMLHQSNLSELC